MTDLPTGDTAWFTAARFGMFIHWGLYALPARHEWIQSQEEIPADEYRRYFEHFDPDRFDPDAWARAAAAAGMRYVVITAKHHEGFCLWDSAHTDYTAVNTPAGRDLLRPTLEAFRRHGLRTGVYYSLIDWHHPDFHIGTCRPDGPYRNHPDRERMNQGRDQSRYAAYMRDQVRELLTDYGPIDIIWFDFSYPDWDGPGSGKGHEAWESERLLRLVRELQPDIIIDDRLDLPHGWDIKTPEQIQPPGPVTVDGEPVPWEACQTFSGSWGYHRDEQSWKSVDLLLRMLVDTVAKGGNLLLNVGPTARGQFDHRALERLAGMGAWMDLHERAIRDCGAAPVDWPAPPDCRYTWNPVTRRLYLHIFAWPFGHVLLPGLAGHLRHAQFLHDGSEVQMSDCRRFAHQSTEKGWDHHDWSTVLMLKLPVRQPPTPVPVIELVCDDAQSP